MTAQDNETIIRRFIEEVLNQRNLDLADELFTSDHLSDAPGLIGEVRGVKAWREVSEQFIDTFPDLHVEIVDLITTEDKGATRIHWTGTLQQEFDEIQPHGQKLDVRGMEFYAFENGKMSAHWTSFDVLSMLRQVGAVRY